MSQMKIIKRSGEEKPFDVTKIENAIRKASQAVDYKDALSEGRIRLIAEEVAGVCAARDRAMTVEEIQDVVETKIMEMGAREIAKKYITYRYKQSLLRQANTTDKQILSLIECNNEDVRRTRTRTRRSTPSSETTWRVKCRRMSRRVCCCRRMSCRHTVRASSISMTWTITPSTCTTATS